MSTSELGLMILSLLAVINVIGIIVLLTSLNRLVNAISNSDSKQIVDRLDLFRTDINRIAERVFERIPLLSPILGTNQDTAKGPSTVSPLEEKSCGSLGAEVKGLNAANPAPLTSTEAILIDLFPGVTLKVRKRRPGGEFSNRG